MLASWKGHLEVVSLLCGKWANMNTAATDTGSTALMIASEKDHIEIVKELRKRGGRK
jgi:ankyrin repeat protein